VYAIEFAWVYKLKDLYMCGTCEATKKQKLVKNELTNLGGFSSLKLAIKLWRRNNYGVGKIMA